MRNSNEPNENRELVYQFLLYMDSYSWTKNSRRLEAALLYLLELDVPEDHLVKEVYAEVAERTGCDWRAAERSLRYAIQRMWKLHTKKCSRLFYSNRDHTACPSVAEFLVMFHTAYKRNTIRSWITTGDGETFAV